MNKVEMFINGKIYSGWTSVRVTRSIKAIAGSFSVSVVNNWASQTKGWIISPLDEAVIKIDGITVITGYVDKISSSFDSGSRSITISGRDKTGDLVDCSYNGPASLEGINLSKFISTVIAPFGLSFKSEVQLPNDLDEFKSQQGETVFAFLERVLKLRGFLITSDFSGNLVISSIGQRRSTTPIEEGVNTLNCSFDFDAVDRFSHYIVKGQGGGSEEFSPEQSSQVMATFVDKGVKRFRPLVVMAEGSVDEKAAQERARWESISRSAKSSALSVKLMGWKKQDKSLWVANEVVNFKSTYFGFNIDLLITEVSYSQTSNEGTVCDISLENKDAYISGENKPKTERDLWKELNPQ